MKWELRFVSSLKQENVFLRLMLPLFTSQRMNEIIYKKKPHYLRRVYNIECNYSICNLPLVLK